MCEWNEKINLTAITEEYDVATKHFLDCLAIFDYVNFKDDDKIIDIGCGAGFPSVVMGIKNKNINITLLDSLNKRITFLNEVIEKLNLKKLEKKKIPDNIEYATIHGLRLEARQKLDKIRPHSIGQASRISGVSPSDINVLLIYIQTL